MSVQPHTTLVVLLTVCCKIIFAAEDIDDLLTPGEEEKQCVWPRPPKNGVNYRQCGNELVVSGQLHQRLCKETPGILKSPGVTKFTECQTGHVMTEGERQSYCVDGAWTGGWEPQDYKCIECGRSLLEEHTVILHGQNADSGDFPWMAALYFKNENDVWENKCGGTLITAHMVLTAAHCLRWSNSSVARPENIKVGFGKLYTDMNKQESYSVIKNVREVVLKERYIGIALNYAEDIAVLDLETALTTNKFIMPACVDWKKKMTITPGETGYLAGYGLTETGKQSEVLKWSTQKYKNYSECLKEIPSLRTKLFTADKFCVISVLGASAMPGDSGGGLTFVKEDVHYVYGVVSTRISVESDNEDIVLFTNMFNHREWLNEQWRRLRPLHEKKTLNKNKDNERPVVAVTKPNVQTRPTVSTVPTNTGGNRAGACKYLGTRSVQRQQTRSCDTSRDSGRWSTVKLGEFPFWAIVGSKDFVDWNHATLISERFLITEALYCVRLKLLGITLTEALVGEYLPYIRGSGGKYKIVQTIVHPQYNIFPADNFENRFRHNLALIKLNTDVRFSNMVSPICLHTAELNPGSKVVLPGEMKSNYALSKENTPIIPKKECDPEDKFALMACVKVDNGRSVWDQNGMPLLIRQQNSQCSFELAGISNYHFTNSPDARSYTKISPYVQWIERVVRQQ